MEWKGELGKNTYKVITASKDKEIEDAINQAVSEGWEVREFGYGSVGLAKFWVLLVKEKKPKQ